MVDTTSGGQYGGNAGDAWRFRWFWRHHGPALLTITATLLLANAIALTGWYRDDPALFLSHLGVGVEHGPVPGFPNWLDPNIGYTTQALGHLSARDWLHLTIPWWDPYQGIGVPLAAELQNNAFFLPFVLLLHFDAGWLYIRLLMQLLAGFFTYALLIQLGLTRASALLAGIMFGCSATFILLAHAPSNTLPFLPLLLLGIERARSSAVAGRRHGWSLITIAVAYSFYAGFPETGIIADAFGGTWFAARLFDLDRPVRWRFAAKFLVATTIGLCLTLPGLIPFLQYVRLGAIGAHAGFYGASYLPLMGLTTEVFPNIFGPFYLQALMPSAWYSNGTLHRLLETWANVGGWFGLLPVMLGIAGIFSANPENRSIRILAISSFLVLQARIFGFPWVSAFFDFLPGVRLIYIMRYAEPLCNFLVILLAAIALDHWQRRSFDNRTIITTLALTMAIALGLLVVGWRGVIAMEQAIQNLPTIAAANVFVMAGLALLILNSLHRKANRSRVAFVGAIIVLDSVVGFGFSQAAGASRGHLDVSGIRYLHAHLGLHRTYAFGPLAPNYGSRYEVAQLNHSMLPVPRLWTGFVKDRLDPYASSINFTEGPTPGARAPHAPDDFAILRKNLDTVESLGVAYILADPGATPLGPGVDPVFRSPAMWIFQVPHPAPYFSVQPGKRCDIRPHGRNEVTAICPKDATLVRRELFYPGWRATVNGHVADVRRASPIFQQITLGEGTSHVTFFYLPPHERTACTVALLALLLWFGLMVVRPSIDPAGSCAGIMSR